MREIWRIESNKVYIYKKDKQDNIEKSMFLTIKSLCYKNQTH